ncbi:MAG TPA: acetyl-CoA C-acetyltransferase [bacterium]|nr:acetyl-CoA C-acetyltransferase [bacterium]
MKPVAILSAVRTPIGRFLGALADVPARDLGIAASREALQRARVAPDEIAQTIFGHARQAGNGPNPARQVSIGTGIPETSPAMTINQACASGLAAIGLGASALRAEEADLVLAGGMESMSRVPYLLERARTGYRLGDNIVVDGMYRDGFHCPLADQLMGATAETLAEKWKISRREQDELALESQRRAGAAWEAGRFADEIVAVPVRDGRGATRIVERDEHLRPDTTLEQIAKLPPVFRESGTVHAGNSSGITDGAAALVLASEREVARRGAKPLAWIAGWSVVGVDPKIMGIGPVPATRRLLEKLGWRLGDIELIELNEAFAAQVLAVARDLSLDLSRTNVNGGAIALGHPIGATGARIVTTLVHEMQHRNAQRGLATLCVSGGMGFSLALTRERPT